MDRFKKFITKSGHHGARQNTHVSRQPSAHPRSTKVDIDRFAKNIVKEYGDTLVKLGKE